MERHCSDSWSCSNESGSHISIQWEAFQDIEPNVDKYHYVVGYGRKNLDVTIFLTYLTKCRYMMGLDNGALNHNSC